MKRRRPNNQCPCPAFEFLKLKAAAAQRSPAGLSLRLQASSASPSVRVQAEQSPKITEGLGVFSRIDVVKGGLDKVAQGVFILSFN